MYRQLLLSAVVFLAGAGAASASDLPPVTDDSDWTGLYGTLSAGYSDISADVSQDFFNGLFVQTNRDSDNSGGALFGIGAGYNHDFGDFVLGLEGDISALTNDSQFDAKTTVDADYDWFATGRLRAGVDLDGTLIYGTGGIAALRADFEDSFGLDSESQSVTFLGWTAGGGVEHMISESWSVRLEALYADFGSEDFHLSPGQAGEIDTEVDLDMFLIRAGISLRL